MFGWLLMAAVVPTAWVRDACGTGSGKLPVLQQQVCGWVQRAVRVLPDQHYI